MSRRKGRQRRTGPRGAGQPVACSAPSTVITLAKGAEGDVSLEIVGLTDADVAEARRQVAAGNLGHRLVLGIVKALLDALGVDAAAYEWTGPEYVQLLELLGFSPFTWSQAEDDELAQLLAGSGGDRG